MAGSAGFVASVDAGAADEGADGVVAEAPGAELVVDGSDGLGSLPPQAASAAMADRTKSFFMVYCLRGVSFSDVSRPAVKKKWQFGAGSNEPIHLHVGQQAN